MEKINPSTFWSVTAMTCTKDIYDAIIRHPFIVELSSGSLPEDKYIYYLRQDRLYLEKYCRVLSHIASRIHSESFSESFIKFASDGIAVERGLHDFFLYGKEGEKKVEMSPTCKLYTSFLLSKAYDPVEVEVAAVLPCFLIYYKVGQHILSTLKISANNPYLRWIETYADKEFEKSTVRATEICDILARQSSPEIRMRMTEAFREGARLEWMFWESAWNLERWKICNNI